MRSAILDALVATPGNRIAVRDDRRSLSYADLGAAVHSESNWLRDHGVERCALLADNGAAWIIADLALLHAQTLNVPIPPWFTPAQTEHVLKDAGDKAEIISVNQMGAPCLGALSSAAALCLLGSLYSVLRAVTRVRKGFP